MCKKRGPWRGDTRSGSKRRRREKRRGDAGGGEARERPRRTKPGRQRRGGVWPSPGWPLHLPSFPLALLPTLPAYCLSPQLPFACLLGSPSPITRPRLWHLLMSPPLLDTLSFFFFFSDYNPSLLPSAPSSPHIFFFSDISEALYKTFSPTLWL